MQRIWSNFSLRTKIASLMSLLVLAAVLALTSLSIQRERANFKQELVEQADLFLETTSLTIRDELYRLQLDELRDVAHTVSDNPDITRFIIYDQSGKILVDSTRPDDLFSQELDPLGQTLIALQPKAVYRNWETGEFISGQAVTLGNQVIGAVAAGMSTQPLDEKISAITEQGILLALVTLFLGGALTMLFARQITIPLSELAAGAAKMADGDLTIRVPQASRDEIGRLAEAFNQMAVGLQEREWLRDLFGRFVSQEVAEAIRTGQVKLEGENRVVSVLFCDIREFTDFSERHTPQEVVTMLNEYLPLVVQSAQKFGGMVNKFGGDSTLIIYGAPHEMNDSAYQAVLTALEIRSHLAQFNVQLVKNGESPLRIGVGINTGMALAGAVGPLERQEYTVVGNTVNLAARIDGLNKQYPEHDVLISGWTYEALGTHRSEFEMISLGVVAIRGKNEPVEIWAVKGKNNRRSA
jgi:class 3 adenylate cyclase